MIGLLFGNGLELTVNAEEIKPTWPEQFYNPKPSDRDLILPMPCGSAMVFRPIEVPSPIEEPSQDDYWLVDRRILLGQENPKVGYKEGPRFSYIAGAFTAPMGHGGRRYFLAKYETTRDQYAVFDGQCPQPSLRPGGLPAVDISWFDAVNFGRRYTEWLLQNAPSKLPIEGEQRGFIRLPTEEEWEFAARGGAVVSDAEFRNPVFPMPDGNLDQYVWYADNPNSPPKSLNPIGLLKPNPLDLYDILGNASEMILTPFQLDHRGRLHGQTGGFMTKGGDAITTSSDQIRSAGSAMREEYPYFNNRTGKANSWRGRGFRLVISMPVLVSHKRLQRIQEEWANLPELMGNPGQIANRVLVSLTTMADEVKDDKLKVKLKVIRRDLERVHAEINETRDRAIKAMIRMGAFLGNKVRIDVAKLRSIERTIQIAHDNYNLLIEKLKGKSNAKHILEQARAKLDEMEGNRKTVQISSQDSFFYYCDMVVNVADDYLNQLIDPQLKILKDEFKAKRSEYLIYYADVFVNHIKMYQKSRKIDSKKWLDEVLKITMSIHQQ